MLLNFINHEHNLGRAAASLLVEIRLQAYKDIRQKHLGKDIRKQTAKQ